MKQRQNHKKQLLWGMVTGLTAMFGIVTHWAAEDRNYDPTCSPFSHKYLCEHRYAYNPGMCKSDLALCSGAGGASICEDTNIEYHDVKGDFFQGETENQTATCRQTEGGSAAYTIWAGHTYMASQPTNCYKKVTCLWDPSSTPGKCVVYEDAGPWRSMPKKKNYYCE